MLTCTKTGQVRQLIVVSGSDVVLCSYIYIYITQLFAPRTFTNVCNRPAIATVMGYSNVQLNVRGFSCCYAFIVMTVVVVFIVAVVVKEESRQFWTVSTALPAGILLQRVSAILTRFRAPLSCPLQNSYRFHPIIVVRKEPARIDRLIAVIREESHLQRLAFQRLATAKFCKRFVAVQTRSARKGRAPGRNGEPQRRKTHPGNNVITAGLIRGIIIE